jgi:tRNA threonylcarbamoyladenosine biosynthesis protein TsaB
MKILAIDSSGLVASVAILTDDNLVAEYTVNFKKTHSQTLLPMLDEIVTMIGMDLKEINAIAVTAGPGSFTGLRIGAATAKGLGLVLDKPLISIPTVESLAYNLFGTEKLICPLMDARRNQVYTGLFEFIGGEFKVISKDKAVTIEEIIEEVNKIGRATIFLGDGVPVYKNIIEENVNVPYYFAPSHLSKQRAGAVGALAKIYLAQGIIETAAEHKPKYLRLTQAERERKEKLELANRDERNDL